MMNYMDLQEVFQKHREERNSNIIKGFVNEFPQEQVIEKGGKKAVIGEIREWNGKRYKKQPNGKWLEVSESYGLTKKEHNEAKYKAKISSETAFREARKSDLDRYDKEQNKHRELASKLSNEEYSDEDLGIIKKAEEAEFEKAIQRQVGDVHPNGKWVWSKTPSGYDWRNIKKGTQAKQEPNKKEGGFENKIENLDDLKKFMRRNEVSGNEKLLKNISLEDLKQAEEYALKMVNYSEGLNKSIWRTWVFAIYDEIKNKNYKKLEKYFDDNKESKKKEIRDLIEKTLFSLEGSGIKEKQKIVEKLFSDLRKMGVNLPEIKGGDKNAYLAGYRKILKGVLESVRQDSFKIGETVRLRESTGMTSLLQYKDKDLKILERNEVSMHGEFHHYEYLVETEEGKTKSIREDELEKVGNKKEDGFKRGDAVSFDVANIPHEGFIHSIDKDGKYAHIRNAAGDLLYVKTSKLKNHTTPEKLKEKMRSKKFADGNSYYHEFEEKDSKQDAKEKFKAAQKRHEAAVAELKKAPSDWKEFWNKETIQKEYGDDKFVHSMSISVHTDLQSGETYFGVQNTSSKSPQGDKEADKFYGELNPLKEEKFKTAKEAMKAADRFADNWNK